MLSSSHTTFLACPAFLVTILSGCQAFQDYRPVAVLVRDIETKTPITGAEVRISYLVASSPFTPYDSVGATGAAGIARLRAAPYGETDLRLDVAANGYLSESQKLKVIAIRHIEPAHWFEKTERRPVDFVVELYAEPEFSIEMVVPLGYRGLIKTEIEIDEGASLPPGQRCFRFEVPSSGNVVGNGPAQLARVLAPSYRAVYADGSPLDGRMDMTKVGCRWLKTEGSYQYFVVGTELEYHRFCQELLAAESREEKSSAGGKGSGRSARRRRGNDSTGDLPPSNN